MANKARIATAEFVIGGDATQRALNEYFGALPLYYQKKATTNIYLKVLRKVQNEIRGNIRSNFKRGSGRLEKSISVIWLKPKGQSKDPAAMVFVSNSYKHSDVFSIKTRRIVKGVSARYAYAQEYGTSVRRKSKTKSSTGALPARPFFRPAIDKWKPIAEQEVLAELAKSGLREMEKQARAFNKKGGTIKIKV